MPSISRGVVVTGANGFVGKNLRNFLHKKKINVLGVSRKNFRKHASEVKITSTNLLEPKLQTKLKNYDVLVHLIGTGRRSPKSMFEEINLNLTKNVIKACKNAALRKSSLSVVLVFLEATSQIILFQNTKLNRK